MSGQYDSGVQQFLDLHGLHEDTKDGDGNFLLWPMKLDPAVEVGRMKAQPKQKRESGARELDKDAADACAALQRVASMSCLDATDSATARF